MIPGETNKDTLAGSCVPTGNLLAVCYFGIEGVDRTSPYMCVLEFAAWSSGFGHQIDERQTSFRIGGVVIRPHNIIDCHRPEDG